MPRSFRRWVGRLLSRNCAGLVAVALITLHRAVLGGRCVNGIVVFLIPFVSFAPCICCPMLSAVALAIRAPSHLQCLEKCGLLLLSGRLD